MSGDGFLSRWARRKREVAREEVRERPVDPAAGSPPAVVVEAIEPHDPERHDPEAITPEELAALPSVEEITDPADFSQYLRKGVPALLRNAAMRRMWMLDPAIRDYVDPALDYAYDWNVPGGVPGNGPLVAGFDAKGEAEKFFSTMRGRISNETGEFETADLEDSRSGDILSRSNEAAPFQRIDESNQDVLGGVPQGEKSSQGAASKTIGENATLVVAEDASSTGAGEEKHAAQGSPRRHGRALPV